jgi:4-phytase / acid phosphatase
MSMKHPLLAATLALLFLPATATQAAELDRNSATDSEKDSIKLVVVIERHGVRSPTSEASQLNQYSSQPWPQWSVPPAYLTQHGARLMTLFGAYDRASFASQGILASSGCEDAAHVTFIADSSERTRETGRALAQGMFPDCPIQVHALPEGTPDPLFHVHEGADGSPDHDLAAAAIAGHIGGAPSQLRDVYRSRLLTMDRILRGCKPQGECVPVTKPTQPLLDIPASLTPGSGSHSVNFHAPLTVAATLSEDILLEYTEGMPMQNVGWGNVDEATLRDLVGLHTANSNLTERTRYLARIQSANLLEHLLLTLRQAAQQKAVPAALGRLGDRIVFVVGHDTNLSNIGGALDLSWLADGRRDDTPPGSALVFELHEDAQSHRQFVKAFFITQTLDQMRNSTSLSLASPPARVPLFLPGCSSSTNECSWESFQNLIEGVVPPAHSSSASPPADE